MSQKSSLIQDASFVSGVLTGDITQQAWLMSDAIGRSLNRLYITRRHLLEWVTAAQATNGARLDLPGWTPRRTPGAWRDFVIRCGARSGGGRDGVAAWVL